MQQGPSGQHSPSGQQDAFAFTATLGFVAFAMLAEQQPPAWQQGPSGQHAPSGQQGAFTILTCTVALAPLADGQITQQPGQAGGVVSPALVVVVWPLAKAKLSKATADSDTMATAKTQDRLSIGQPPCWAEARLRITANTWRQDGVDQCVIASYRPDQAAGFKANTRTLAAMVRRSDWRCPATWRMA
jgi:hypothetical protein